MEHSQLIGKRLKKGVFTKQGILLVPPGIILTEKHISKMKNFKINIDDIELETFEVNHPSPSKEPRTQEEEKKVSEPPPNHETDIRKLVNQVGISLKGIEEYIYKNGKVPVQNTEETIVPMIRQATKNKNLFKLFSTLKEEGDFRYKHSIGVAIVATMLGKWLNLSDDELNLLTTAATLYDIGAVKLPSTILHQKTRYTPNEYEIVKQHTIMGYELLKESGVNPRIALVALQHHERCDGSGYPSKIKGAEIDRLSKIISIVDVYLALISDRPHRKALPFYEAIEYINISITHNRFDTQIGMTFLNRLMEAQVGSEVILTDQRRGKILIVNPNYPTRPLIAADNEVIDLSKEKTIKIGEIIG
jgi:HD-GYP domain-containing protein (c-di-GMP phosphodiesterase class II)